ncbi:hypothetical protein CLU79DRAFT_781073 [Phycomyces nitens]|nr:hypothetical protein CLU79DRAFT_781073 [Phycomyces nitens]
MNDNLFFPNADFMDTTDTETFTGDQMLFLLTQFQDIITQLEGRVVELETDLLTIHDRYTNSPPIRSKRISRRTDGYCRSPCRPTKNSAGRGLLRTLEMFKPTHKGVGASKGFPHSTKLSFRALCLPDLINKNLNSAGTTACLGQSTDSNTKPTKQALDHQMSSKAASESGMPGSWKLHLECPSLSFNSLYEEPMKSIFWPFKEESPRSHLVSQEREKTGLDFDCTKELVGCLANRISTNEFL